MTQEELDQHCGGLIQDIADRRVIPLLGAGVNLCDRPQDQGFAQGQFLPSGAELSRHLARRFNYPEPDTYDLLRVAQYGAVIKGDGPLYEELRRVFNDDYPPTQVHNFLAQVPPTLSHKGLGPGHQLIVTTNYDDALEKAFENTGQEVDVVTYVADGPNRGKFVHSRRGMDSRLIDRPNEYQEVSLEKRTVVLKIHGAVDRTSAEGDSYVITEDHYIDYLTRTELGALIPATLVAKLKRSHFLFLGYSLRDWNLRVILHRLWGSQALKWKSWAVQLKPSIVETEFWRKRGVDIIDKPLHEYITALEVALQGLEAAVPPNTQASVMQGGQ